MKFAATLREGRYVPFGPFLAGAGLVVMFVGCADGSRAGSAGPDREMPVRIGLTGGIGSGKSTVAGMLVARGAALIDTDAISRALHAAGGAAMPALTAAFGDAMVGRRRRARSRRDARARVRRLPRRSGASKRCCIR